MLSGKRHPGAQSPCDSKSFQGPRTEGWTHSFLRIPQRSVLTSGSQKSPGSLDKGRGGGSYGGTVMHLENAELAVNPTPPRGRGLLSPLELMVCISLRRPAAGQHVPEERGAKGFCS